MKRNHTLRIAAMAAAVAALTGVAAAQGTGEAGTTGLVADPNGAAPIDLINQLTPEELEKVVRKADAMRLQDERQKVVDEITAGLIFDESSKTDAEGILTAQGGALSQQDNIERVFKAFAKVETPFRRAYQMLAEGKNKECVEAAKQLLKEDETDFNGAAKHYLYAEALAKLSAELKKAGQEKPAKDAYFDSIEAYMEITRLMPERISFASSAAMKAGKAYEDAGRFMNAMRMYAFALRNYSITLTANEREDLLKKLEEWQEIFKDPLSVMKHVSGKMGEVEKRLAATDSGKDTQDRERQIVQVLEDLIKTIEENQNAQSQSGAKGQGKEKKPGEGQSESQGQGQGQNQGNKPQGAQQQPSSPARSSFLPPGTAVRPGKMESPHMTNENSDWSELPPTDRDKLTESMKKMLSERYRDLVSDYTKSLSETEKKPK